MDRTCGKKLLTYEFRRISRAEKWHYKILDRGKHFGKNCSPQHSGAGTPYQSARRHLSEESNLQRSCCKNPKTQIWNVIGKVTPKSVILILTIELHKQTLPISVSRRFPTNGVFDKCYNNCANKCLSYYYHSFLRDSSLGTPAWRQHWGTHNIGDSLKLCVSQRQVANICTSTSFSRGGESSTPKEVTYFCQIF